VIENVRIQNFKCLRDVKVDLDPFTVLIGLNDSGKTSFLEALLFLGEIARGQALTQIFSGPTSLEELVWNKDQSLKLTWHVNGRVGGYPFDYTISLSPRREDAVVERLVVNGEMIFEVSDDSVDSDAVHDPQRMARFQGVGGVVQTLAWYTPTSLFGQVIDTSSVARAVAGMLGSPVKYRLDPAALRRPADLGRDVILESSGENLAAVLDGIMNSGTREAGDAIDSIFREQVPTLRGIALRPPAQARGGSGKALEVTLSAPGRKPKTIPAELTSDGALLLLAILSLAYGGSPEVVLLEEPENGLHFSRLRVVVDLLGKISTGELGNLARQVIVTTHSPVLLNLVDPKNVRIFVRRIEQGTEVIPMGKIPNIENLKKEFATGELWYLLGEEGLVQGGAQ